MQIHAKTQATQSKVLLTGATGYIGGRLAKRLEERGYPLRCLARRPEYLRSRLAGSTEIVAGDIVEGSGLEEAFKGCQVAFYLVHSMGSTGDFEVQDRQAARNFAAAAKAVGIERIIYLGGLGDSREVLSPHLRSRQEVGEILRASGVPVIELRASIVIGSGSLSFELIRALTERLPLMITPLWVHTPAQPIAVEDLLEYLVASIAIPVDGSPVFEVGGADRATYAEIMMEYARQRGLRRSIVSVPVLTARLSSLWLGLVTPIYARVGRKLIESLRHPTVVRDPAAQRVFAIRPRGIKEAISRALRNEDYECAQTQWSDALSSLGQPRSWGGVRFGSRIVDSRTLQVPCTPAAAFAPIRRIGGSNGWYYGDWLWSLRGLLDLLVGGAGVRRGRKNPEQLQPGDAVDFWRVEACEPDRLLRLAAEMKLPGRAWLEFEVREAGPGSIISQTAIFDPVGIAGLAYWYLLYPIHQLIFAGMLRGIAAAAGNR